MAHMSHPTHRLERFKQAILQMEADHDVKPVVQMFADHATLDTPAHEQPLVGRQGAAEFWSEYLESFQTIESRFTHEFFVGETGVLEWRSTGTLPTGRFIDYRGASIIHFKGEEIESFTAYYDSAAFVMDAPRTIDVSLGTNNEGGD